MLILKLSDRYFILQNNAKMEESSFVLRGIPHEVYAGFDMTDSDLNDFWCISRPMRTHFKNVKKNFFDPPDKF